MAAGGVDVVVAAHGGASCGIIRDRGAAVGGGIDALLIAIGELDPAVRGGNTETGDAPIAADPVGRARQGKVANVH
ncbi:hypothetical protein GCM10022255_094880 [Dactylosporangium darangshiense]|uniref:Uncharacterized protein n=1 Tax=Dactylosporangium darangshiense TaxID=579108 RepID=A0ABP8DQC3_9ACTN